MRKLGPVKRMKKVGCKHVKTEKQWRLRNQFLGRDVSSYAGTYLNSGLISFTEIRIFFYNQGPLGCCLLGCSRWPLWAFSGIVGSPTPRSVPLGRASHTQAGQPQPATLPSPTSLSRPVSGLPCSLVLSPEFTNSYKCKKQTEGVNFQ